MYWSPLQRKPQESMFLRLRFKTCAVHQTRNYHSGLGNNASSDPIPIIWCWRKQKKRIQAKPKRQSTKWRNKTCKRKAWSLRVGLGKTKTHGFASKHAGRSRSGVYYWVDYLFLCWKETDLSLKPLIPPIPSFLSSKSTITKALSSLSCLLFASNSKESACSYPALHTFCTGRFPCSFKLWGKN